MITPIRYSEQVKKLLLDRKSVYSDDVQKSVKGIIAEVIKRGDAALGYYTEKFDGVKSCGFRVDDEEFDAAVSRVDTQYIDILQRCAANISDFHKRQLRTGFEIKCGDCVIGEKITPLATAGIYVPGGTAAYPSTVLMNAIPAKIAGVGKIVMVSPPQADGKIKDEVLAAAKIAGVDEIYKIGGAQAIAALAFGTESIPKVDVVVGPGNIYVATAKKELFGVCGIDMVAGPSEILIIGDGSCYPEFVAADMLSQAEHDVLATALFITTSSEIADAVSRHLDKRVKLLPRRKIAEKSLENNCKIIVCDTIEEALALSDEIAPEHLELAVNNPFGCFERIKNAGSVFLGHNTPEAVGDYFAGTNHTLPTGGTAKFSSPLGVGNFIKATQYVYYTKEKLARSANDIITFANSEGLDAHAESVALRGKE